MEEALKRSELFENLERAHQDRLMSIARQQSLSAGEYLFLIGDHADRLFVVAEGTIETCFPFSFEGAIRDVAVGTKSVGDALGWSALVKPYRFTLSARAAEPSRILTFARQDLEEVLDADPAAGRAFMSRMAEVIGRRLLTFQTLWARELQRAVDHGWVGSLEEALAGEGEQGS